MGGDGLFLDRANRVPVPLENSIRLFMIGIRQVGKEGDGNVPVRLNLNKDFSFRWKIFIFYTLFVSFLLTALTVSFYIYFSKVLTDNSVKRMDQSVQRISEQLDTMLENMDDITKILLYSKDLQDILLDTSAFSSVDSNYFDIHPDHARKVNEIIISILGTNNIPAKVSIFNGKYNRVYLSTRPDSNMNPQTNQLEFPWKPVLDRKDTYALTLPPHRDPWSPRPDAPYVVSFIRKVLSTTLRGQSLELGYIEVQQAYDMIVKIVEPSLSDPTKIYILDDQGSVIYPIDHLDAGDALFYYRESKDLKTLGAYETHNPRNGRDELIYATVSPENRWTIMQVMFKSDFTGAVRKFQLVILFAGLLLLIFTLFVMFLISASLTAPLRKLHRSLKHVSLQTPALSISLPNTENEIVFFVLALNKMIARLQESMNQTIEARSKEVQAHFQALQAQIDPHFLYNTLMGISAVAQEEGNPKVIEMCLRLSRMLRYAGSFESSIIEMSEEINHTMNYVHLYKFRYENHLQYEFVLDDNIRQVQVPKLILQPLIENCFSHGFANRKPPYLLSIKGTVTGTSWVLHVTDNGSGFQADVLERLQRQMREYDYSLQNNDYENKLTFGGMAICNIYARLKIVYREQCIFELSNNENGGATVTIGGKIT